MLKIKKTDPDAVLGKPGSDLEDYAIFSIEKPSVPFALSKADFSRDTLERQAVNVIAMSLPPYYIYNYMPKDWTKAIRFTRLNEARIWSFVEAGGTDFSATLQQECLLYRAPTFPGMSGAPILALRRQQDASIRLFVVGIHIRNGPPKLSCGSWPEFNVGLRLPLPVIGRIK